MSFQFGYFIYIWSVKEKDSPKKNQVLIVSLVTGILVVSNLFPVQEQYLLYFIT